MKKTSSAISAKRFYDFCRMRLRGESDTTYRNYDLLRDKLGRLDRPFKWMVRHAGLFWPMGEEYEVLTTLQRQFEDMGFGVISTPGVKKLVKEFYVYSKIRWENMNWHLRDPDEALMLLHQHQAVTDQTTA